MTGGEMKRADVAKDLTLKALDEIDVPLPGDPVKAGETIAKLYTAISLGIKNEVPD